MVLVESKTKRRKLIVIIIIQRNSPGEAFGGASLGPVNVAVNTCCAEQRDRNKRKSRAK